MKAMAINRRLQIRPTKDETKLNQTESDYLSWLQCQGCQWIGVQCITLKIGDDCRLTVDFWALDDTGLRAIDTKACHKGKTTPHIEDDAMVKLKVAARMYPWIHFVIAWRIENVWHHRAISP